MAVDVSPERLAAAARFGATHTFDARALGASALQDAIRAATGGLGVDASFEAAGLPATFESAMQALRKGGRVVMVGLMPHAGFDAFRAVNDELTFTASVGYRHAYEDLLRIVASGALDLTSIVTRTVSLEDAVSDGFDALLADRAQIKILVSPAQRPPVARTPSGASSMSRQWAFEGQSVVVTGGTSGIGARTAMRFAEAGASVVALGQCGRPACARACGRSLRGTRRDRQRCADAHDRGAAAARRARQRRRHQPARGRIPDGPVRAVLNVNLTSVMRASDAARPALSAHGGSIVNVASMYTYFGSKDRPAYSASKAASRSSRARSRRRGPIAAFA